MKAWRAQAPMQVLSAEWLPVGTRVGRWEVVGRLGDGGFGTVYAVRRPGWRRRGLYALKLARRPDDERFGSEARGLRRVLHRGVVRLVEEGAWRAGPVRYPYLVLEYVRGESLYGWALARNPTARQVVELLAQAAEALAAAHRRGVLHRDFKGGNVRVQPCGLLKVLDWGAVWYEGAPVLTSEARLPPGTAPYYSPRAHRWRLDARHGNHGGRYQYTVADELYAVGVTFYRLLAEEYPPPRLTEGDAHGGEGLGPRPVDSVNPRVPAALASLVMRLLAFHPQGRPEGAGALADEARRLLAEEAEGWNAPLFAWESGPSSRSRTTQGASGAGGPMAPGQEVALLNTRAHYRDRMRAARAARELRRRDAAAVRTQGAPEARKSVPGGRGLQPWHAAVTGCFLAMVGLAWAVSPPALPASPARVSAPTEHRKVASPPTPSEASTPPAASLSRAPPRPEEVMPQHPTLQSRVPRAPDGRPGVLATLKRGTVAAGAAAMLTACPGAQVRPDSARCAPEVLECMRKQLGLEPGMDIIIRVEEDRAEVGDLFVMQDGPIVSVTREKTGRLPTGSRVFGRLWTGGAEVIGRYTRVETPDGQSYPVCFNLGDTVNGYPKHPDSQPGVTVFGNGAFLTVVKEFPILK